MWAVAVQALMIMVNFVQGSSLMKHGHPAVSAFEGSRNFILQTRVASGHISKVMSYHTASSALRDHMMHEHNIHS